MKALVVDDSRALRMIIARRRQAGASESLMKPFAPEAKEEPLAILGLKAG